MLQLQFQINILPACGAYMVKRNTIHKLYAQYFTNKKIKSRTIIQQIAAMLNLNPQWLFSLTLLIFYPTHVCLDCVNRRHLKMFVVVV